MVDHEKPESRPATPAAPRAAMLGFRAAEVNAEKSEEKKVEKKQIYPADMERGNLRGKQVAFLHCIRSHLSPGQGHVHQGCNLAELKLSKDEHLPTKEVGFA